MFIRIIISIYILGQSIIFANQIKYHQHGRISIDFLHQLSQ